MKNQMFKSPLEKVVQDQKLNLILKEIRNRVARRNRFWIAKEDVCHVRKAFCSAIELGEKELYSFAQELIHAMIDCPASFFVEVWGRCPQKRHREIQKNQVRIQESFDHLRAHCACDSHLASLYAPICWCGAKTISIASFVKGVAERENTFGIRMLSTRIKTPASIAYKVTDMLFDIDRMFRRDKILNRYSQILKDMYGIKIITTDFNALQKTLEWFKEFHRHEILETKDYLGSKKKKSGFEAYKFIIQRPHQVIEIQLQTEAMLERETLGFRENHHTYKEKQLRMRAQLGNRYMNVYNTLQVLLCSRGTYCRDLAV